MATPNESSQKLSAINYLWFRGASVQELRERLNEAGENAILMLIPHNGKFVLRVQKEQQIPDGGTERIAAVSVHETDINDSLICPPRCI